MTRLSSALVFTTIFGFAGASIDLAAQGRGTNPGRGGGGGGFRGAPVSTPAAPAVGPSIVAPFTRSPVAPFTQSPVAPFMRSPVAPAPAVGASHFPGLRPQRTVIFSQPFSYGYASPYVWSTPFYGASLYAEPAYVTPQVVQAPAADQNDADLTSAVQRLAREVEELRSEQAARLSLQARPQPQSEPGPPATPTTLVFRDGRRVDIQNYAIVGQTLWVLEERVSTKVSVSELDLEATQRENRGRGVRFPLPEK
jgi:hypothetical protein